MSSDLPKPSQNYKALQQQLLEAIAVRKFPKLPEGRNLELSPVLVQLLWFCFGMDRIMVSFAQNRSEP